MITRRGSHRRPNVARVLTAGALLLAGCAGAAGVAVCRPLAWEPVTLPGSMAPRSLGTSGPDLLIGGQAEGGAPALVVWRDGVASPLPVTAKSPYGQLAALIYVSGDGHHLAAIGNATGGAHLNPRWSVFTGGPAGLVELPQTMETFGGEDAGWLNGITETAAGPRIAGSWSGAAGQIETAVWALQGTAFVRQPTPASMSSTDQLLTLPAAVASLDGRPVVAGLLTRLGSGRVHQSAAAWVGGTNGWVRVDLDHSADNSVASGLSCSGADCWIVGRVGSRLAAWRLAGSSSQPVRGVPTVPVRPGFAYPRIAVSGGTVVIWPGAGDEIQVLAGGRWRGVTAPPGVVGDVAVTSGAVAVLTQDAGEVSVSTTTCVPGSAAR